MSFNGLTPELFSTYTKEKWSSMVHNLARMKAKDTLVTLATAAALDLEEELSGLDRAASDEIPNITNGKKVDAQWVYWFRDKAGRAELSTFLKATPLDQATIFNIAPHDKHSTLAVIAREAGLWVGFRVGPGASIDRHNLASKLSKSWEREALLALFKELPDGMRIGHDDDSGDVVSTEEVDDTALIKFSETLGAKDGAFAIGHLIEANEAVEFGVDLLDNLRRWLGVLVPVYRFAAWSRDNDYTEVAKKIQEEKAHARHQATSYKPGDKVRIVGGLFSGKRGVVESTDTKANVKVSVAGMAIVVAGADLVAD